jgi:tungstate transport system substrate-binding protein
LVAFRLFSVSIWKKESLMSRCITLLFVIAAVLLPFSSVVAQERLILATTTSTENSGLLEILLPPFEKQNNVRVDVIAVGTGQAIKLGENGDADVVMVHARAMEDAFVAAGYGVKRHDLMYNDFVILGPATDPAGASTVKSAVEAFARIAATQEKFISRADLSGTHAMERHIWQSAGLNPDASWYIEAGRGMGEVIQMATELQGYALADRGTYLAYLDKTDLVIVTQGDERLFNPYGVIAVNPLRHPHVNHKQALALIDYLLSATAREIISGFQVNGKQLFFVYE